MGWERDVPCLALQCIDNKVVSLLTTIESANYRTTATRKTNTAGGVGQCSGFTARYYCKVQSIQERPGSL